MANRGKQRRERKADLAARRGDEVRKRRQKQRPPDVANQHFVYHVDWEHEDGDIDAAIDRAKRYLDEMMGDTRASQIKVLTATGREKANAALDEMKANPGTGFAELVRRTRAKVREWGGVVVIAYAEREPPCES